MQRSTDLDQVMTFVNQIAEIVHGVVDECWGAVNKNDGARDDRFQPMAIGLWKELVCWMISVLAHCFVEEFFMNHPSTDGHFPIKKIS